MIDTGGDDMFVAGQDLGSTLLWLSMSLGLVAAVTALAVWSARRRGRGGTTIVLDATATLAPMGLVVLALGSALALGALGAVFQHGYALQRQTEGLV